MKMIIIIFLLLMLFGGLVTFLSIRKKAGINTKKARLKIQQMKEETRKDNEKLRQEMSDDNE